MANDSAVVVVILFVLVFAGVFIVLGVSSVSQRAEAPSGAYSYLVNESIVSGTKYYYAYNPNARLVYGGPKNIGGATGTNFSAVFQSSADSLKCGAIVFSPQIFNMTHGVHSYPCISLTGVARTGDFQTQPNSTLISDTDCARPAITLKVNPTYSGFKVFPSIAGLTITSNGACASTQDGIYDNETNGAILDITLSYDAIFAMGGNCINLGTTNAHTWIDNMYLEDCHQNGITGKGNIFLSNSYIFGNSLYGVYHVTGSGLNSFHNYFLDNVEGAVFCANINNQCMSQDDTMQNNGGPSYAQFSVATSNSPTANPTVIQGDVFTDSRTSGAALAQINFEATLVNAMVEGNYFYSSPSDPVTCFKFLTGGYIAGGSLGNVLITGNQSPNNCNSLVGKVGGNFLIGGTSATTTHYIGAFEGNSTTPIASQTYTAANTNQLITCSGGTSVSITIIDPKGNTIETLGACPTTLIDLPVGWSINFGTFLVAPTVTDWVKSI